MVPKKQQSLAIGIAALLAFALAACGQESHKPGSTPSLTIALASVASDVPNRIALEKGLFEKHGVKVTLDENVGQNVPSVVASGRADLGVYSLGGPASLAAKGQKVSVLYDLGAGSGSGSVLVDAHSKVKTLDELHGCTMVTQATGTASYGNARRYNADQKLGCKVSPLADPAAQIGAVVSGHADAIVGTLSNYAAAIKEGKLKVIVDTAKPTDQAKYVNPNYPLVILFGRKDKIAEKEKALTAYFQALDEATQVFKDSSDQEVAQIVKGESAYKGMSVDQVAASVKDFRASFQIASDAGLITASQWQDALDAMSLFGIPGLDVHNSALSYDNIVDPKPLENARKAS